MVSLGRIRSVSFSVVVVLAAGCGDDGPAFSGESETSTTDDTTVGTSVGPTSSTTDDTSSSSPGTTDGEESTAAAESSTGEPVPEIDVEIIRHQEQPMVVDVTLTSSLPVASMALTHDDDAGVRIAELDATELATTFRVRGLAPDTDHALTYQADSASGPVEFVTYPPLPGFVPAFEVEGASAGERPWRLFDVIPFPGFETSSLFMVNTEGETRWHLGWASEKLPRGRIDGAKLLEDGTVLFAFENRFLVLDELGHEVVAITDEELGILGMHHEAMQLPNGNYMVLSWSFQDVDYPGAPGTYTAGDVIAEFTADGDLVWQWDTFDHLDPLYVTEPIGAWEIPHPETLEAAYDWTHGNGLDYDEASDTVFVSLRHLDWVVAIEHSTGDVLWRLGPGGDFTLTAGEWFYHQHSPQFQPDGSLLIYDNGIDDPVQWPTALARAVRYDVDLVGFEVAQVWEDDAEDFMSPFAGDADLIPENGNYHVLDSTIQGANGWWGRLRELDPDASPQTQWSLRTADGTFVYRATANDRLVGESAP
jgi:hypothetical protein